MLKDKKNQIRIGIDARFFGPKQKGLGRYVQKLVEGLEETDKHNQYVIFLRKDNWHDFQPKNPNFRKALADYKWYSLKEQLFMPFKVWRQKVDLMHYPHFNIPIFQWSPFVVTIHDLVLRRFPTRRASSLGPLRYFIKNLAYRIVIWTAVKRSKKVIAVSNYTKQDILKHFKVSDDKVVVIYEGAPVKKNNFYIPISNLKQYNISKPYVLYVGNAYPHKNLERLILSFSKIIGNSNELEKEKYKDLQLVLVGELDYFYQRLKNMTAYSLPHIRERIVFCGLVTDEQLSVLYQNADLYIFPSLCEGFGLPPLEAMTYGAPVVSSSATCLPEVLGEAALYFNPDSVDEMVTKVKQVLEDGRLRQQLIKRGYVRIKAFRWSAMAKETLEFYYRSLNK